MLKTFKISLRKRYRAPDPVFWPKPDPHSCIQHDNFGRYSIPNMLTYCHPVGEEGGQEDEKEVKIVIHLRILQFIDLTLQSTLSWTVMEKTRGLKKNPVH